MHCIPGSSFSWHQGHWVSTPAKKFQFLASNLSAVFLSQIFKKYCWQIVTWHAVKTMATGLCPPTGKLTTDELKERQEKGRDDLDKVQQQFHKSMVYQDVWNQTTFY